jgi:hypothetical protein
MRKAPRNFTLTPQMVGKKPPLPRAYPAFRFVTALATLLFFVTMGVNFLAPQLAQPTAFGMGGGGAPDVYSAQAPAAAATQAPAATEVAATEAATEAPLASMAAMPTATVAIEAAPASTFPPALEDTARAAENPAEKSAPAQPQDQNGFSQRQNVQPPVSPAWIILLAGIALFGAVIMLLMRRLAAERWRGK